MIVGPLKDRNYLGIGEMALGDLAHQRFADLVQRDAQGGLLLGGSILGLGHHRAESGHLPFHQKGQGFSEKPLIGTLGLLPEPVQMGEGVAAFLCFKCPLHGLDGLPMAISQAFCQDPGQVAFGGCARAGLQSVGQVIEGFQVLQGLNGFLEQLKEQGPWGIAGQLGHSPK